MPDTKDTQHDLKPHDTMAPDDASRANRGVPKTTGGENAPKGRPTDDRQQTETAGEDGSPP